ncbi:MAG: aldo/keto reductase [Polyangiales bacterium]
MRKRSLGKTGLEVSELGLGTLGLAGEAYGPVSDEDVEKTVARARELGITLIDTADNYGAGEGHEPMESRLGKLLAGDDEVVFCTKGGNDPGAAPPRKRFDRMFLHRCAARSAERLRRKPDIYLLHHPTVETLRRGEATGSLDELVTEGVIGKWGVACGDVEVARVAISLGTPVIQVAYNLFHQRDLHEILDEASTNDVGILTRSPLSYGLLCGTWPAERTFPEGDHRRDRWTPEDLRERLKQVAALRPLVQGEIHTLRSVALRFVLSNLMVGSCIVGVRNAAQIEQNVRAIGEGPPYLSDEDLGKVPTILEAAGVVV